MAILGDNATPGSSGWFDVTGNKQYWVTAAYAMPAGGGIASNINVYAAGDGASITAQILLWDNAGNIFYQTGNMTFGSGTRAIGGQAWQTSSGINGKYIPAGNYFIGFWSSGNVVWTTEAVGGVLGRSGLASPGTATGGADEYAGGGLGRLGAYVTYTPGGIVRLNTGTPGAPNFVTNAARVQTGPPGAPVWTNGRWRANQGTPGAPNWVDAS